MIFNEIKCRVNTTLGLVGGCIPPVSAPAPVIILASVLFHDAIFTTTTS